MVHLVFIFHSFRDLVFVKLRNALLEVWVWGKEMQRQDTDLNRADRPGFLPLTSSTLLRRGDRKKPSRQQGNFTIVANQVDLLVQPLAVHSTMIQGLALKKRKRVLL